ncbi:hypothetical protein [Streptomyces longisporoflavus]|uniref:Uncharacterized protein n=1 Tax=Streptomyces longisporoflavus TaxID=28044 RepID=A0ABW7R4U0_9ACTN
MRTTAGAVPTSGRGEPRPGPQDPPGTAGKPGIGKTSASDEESAA